MKNLIRLTAMIGTLAAIGFSAQAKTDTAKAMERLKTNAENAEYNYKQYQDNLDIVNKNHEEADKAIKELRKLQSQLEKNTKNVDKNKLALKQMEAQIAALKQKEEQNIATDDKKIAEVKALLEKLEANKRQRQANVVAYDNMMVEVKKEQAEWDTQVQQMATLQAEIAKKEQKAVSERSHWTAKRKDYESEAKRWGGEYRKAKDAYDHQARLK